MASRPWIVFVKVAVPVGSRLWSSLTTAQTSPSRPPWLAATAGAAVLLSCLPGMSGRL
jgi:hypothetical protein